VTADYNPHMFFILKTTFIPHILQLQQSGDFVQAIEDYQQVVKQCWNIVKQQRTEITAEELIQFLQLAFYVEILEGYQIIP
jgi:hypothetical protein